MHKWLLWVAFGASTALAYEYESGQKQDPFAPLGLPGEGKGAGPLTASEIGQYKLVGTLIGDDAHALILPPSSQASYLVRTGDRLGNRGGKVLVIADDRVIVREQVGGRPDAYVDAELPLQKPEAAGDKPPAVETTRIPPPAAPVQPMKAAPPPSRPQTRIPI